MKIDRRTLKKIFKKTSVWVQGEPGKDLYDISVLNEETGARIMKTGIFDNKIQAQREAKKLRKELIREEIENEITRRIYAEMDRQEEKQRERWS